MRYEATDDMTCEPENVCRNCMGSANFTEEHADYKCFAVPEKEAIEVPCFGKEHCVVQPYPRLGIGEFGTIPALDTKTIMQVGFGQILAILGQVLQEKKLEIPHNLYVGT